jgi:hypothetical protein
MTSFVSTERSFLSYASNSHLEKKTKNIKDRGLINMSNGSIKTYNRVKDTVFQGLLDTKHVGAVYNVLDSVGEGTFGIVRIVQKNNYEQLKFTMKMVPLEEGEEHMV